MGVLVVGDVLTDTVVQLHAPLRHGGDAAAVITDAPGGQGANVARWLVAAGTSDVRLMAAISTHDPADHIARLDGFGITPLLVPVDAPVARIVVITEPNGTERSFLTQRGAGAMLDEHHADMVDLSDVNWCHVSGYVLASASGRQCYARLVQRCAKLCIPVSVDPASISEIASLGPEAFLQAIGHVTLLTPNDAEAAALTNSAEPAVAAKLLLKHADITVVTCGVDGAVTNSNSGGPSRVRAVQTVVVDPTGAGDAFAAGLINWLVSNPDRAVITDGLSAASDLAARAVRRVGAGPS
jgi:sugar/nucleoside kinase (ribokinase family)